jgi:hypothetical protein
MVVLSHLCEVNVVVDFLFLVDNKTSYVQKFLVSVQILRGNAFLTL